MLIQVLRLKNRIAHIFTNNIAEGDGGAVYWDADGGSMIDCSFIDNIAEGNGGAVFWNGTDWLDIDSAKESVKRSGTFAQKPSASDIYVGFRYFCTDKQTTEGATDGIEIIHKGNDVWVDALGRVVS